MVVVCLEPEALDADLVFFAELQKSLKMVLSAAAGYHFPKGYQVVVIVVFEFSAPRKCWSRTICLNQQKDHMSPDLWTVIVIFLEFFSQITDLVSLSMGEIWWRGA